MKYLLSFLLGFLFLVVKGQESNFTSHDAIRVKGFSGITISDDGQWVAGKISARKDRFDVDHFRFRDPSYIPPFKSELVIINSESGEKKTISPPQSIVGQIAFSRDSEKLAYTKVVDSVYRLFIYDLDLGTSKEIELKDDRLIASTNSILWSADHKAIVLPLKSHHSQMKGDSLYQEATIGPITVYDGSNPLLKWEEIAYYNNLCEIVKVDIENGEVIDLVGENIIEDLELNEAGDSLSYIRYQPKKTAYDRKNGGLSSMHVLSLSKPNKQDTLVSETFDDIKVFWNTDKTHFAFLDSNHIHIQSISSPKARRLSIDTMEIVKGDTTDASFSFLEWRPDGKAILISSKTAYWKIEIGEDGMEKVYDLPKDDEEAPKRNFVHWTADGGAIYMTYSDRDKWYRGMVLYDIQNKAFTELHLDASLYMNWRLSKDGTKFFYNYSDGNLPVNLFVTDADFQNTKQLTDLNPWIKSKKIARSELIKYRDVDGNELNGILYYPVDYKEGEKYPLVCELYETFFDNGYRYSCNMIANAGYFCFRPSVTLEKGYPGEAWIKGVANGINKLIDKGLVDEEKLGVHGVSYGGYATSLLISQTDRFAAAINISGKTNIISFLGDSPKIGTRNYAAAEVGQDRIGANLWEAPLKYINTSAVMFADRIKTPHLLLTGEGDWNVTALNTRELYYALRRLDKEVVWVNYQKAGHGAGYNGREADFHDQWNRIVGWYKTHFEKVGED